MALHPLLAPRTSTAEPAWDRHSRLEADLAEARSMLRRLLEVEDRIGLVHPIIDDARRWLAHTTRR